MLALIADALAGRARGVPESWRRRIRSAAQPRDAAIVRSLATPGYSVVPDLVFPGNPGADIDVGTQVEMLRDLPGQALLDELEMIVNGRPPPHWQAAVDEPDLWIRGYADLLQRTWSVMEDVWKQARPLVDREIQRVAIAAARGAMDAVLNDLHADCMFQDGAFSFPDMQPERFYIGSRRLVLMPMLAGATSMVSHLDGPEVVWIGYPLPGAGALSSSPPGSARKPGGKDDPLVLLIGDVRAAILNHLDRPLTMGMLAEITRHAPNAVTYHCDRLETTGLIYRRRSGREIHVYRTDRATALVNLFGS
jgi:DNA-binding transcriptional ArsR family regulator